MGRRRCASRIRSSASANSSSRAWSVSRVVAATLASCVRRLPPEAGHERNRRPAACRRRQARGSAAARPHAVPASPVGRRRAQPLVRRRRERAQPTLEPHESFALPARLLELLRDHAEPMRRRQVLREHGDELVDASARTGEALTRLRDGEAACAEERERVGLGGRQRGQRLPLRLEPRATPGRAPCARSNRRSCPTPCPGAPSPAQPARPHRRPGRPRPARRARRADLPPLRVTRSSTPAGRNATARRYREACTSSVSRSRWTRLSTSCRS